MSFLDEIRRRRRGLTERPGLTERALREKLTERPRRLRSWTESYVLTVPASGTKTEEKRIPLTSSVKQIVLHFPAGLQATTAIFFSIEGQQVFPPREQDTIALDDATIPYSVDIEVKEGDRLKMHGSNSDTVNAHTVRAQVTVFAEVPEGES